MLTLVAAFVMQTSLSLQVGQTWSATLDTSIIDPDGSIFKTDTESLVFTVFDTDGPKFKIQTKRRMVKTVISGSVVPTDDNTPPTSTDSVVDPNRCFAMPELGGEQVETRLSRLFQLIHPPTAADTWKSSLPKVGRVPAMSFDYAMGKNGEGKPIWEVAAQEEKGFAATGKVELQKNGLPKLIEWTVKKAITPDGEEAMDVKMVYKIVPADK